MTFDLDEAIENILPWDLTIKINGQELVTRRPTVAEYSALMGMEKMSDAKALKLLGSLFEPPLDAARFGTPRVQGLLVTYLTYFKSRALKNPMAIASQVLKAIAEQSTTPSSTTQNLSDRSSNLDLEI